MNAGRFTPLPALALDRSLSDVQLQARWLAGATQQRDALLQRVRALEQELREARTALGKAQEFVREAQAAYARYVRMTEQHAARIARPAALPPPQSTPTSSGEDVVDAEFHLLPESSDAEG